MAKGKKTGGRKAGTQNKLTKTAKEAFQHAFDVLQDKPGVKLGEWAAANPTEFYKLYARLIPAEIDAKVSAHDTAVELLARGIRST